MILQDAPAAFNWVVLAMVRRVRHQPHVEVIILDKIDEPLHKLCASALIFRTIIEIDPQHCDRSEPLADGLPPLGEAIHQAVTGDFRGHGVHKQFIQCGEKNAHGGHGCLRGKIVVSSLDLDTAFPAPGEGANFDGRFGIQRDAQDIVCRLSGVVDLGYLFADRVGFQDFFCG